MSDRSTPQAVFLDAGNTLLRMNYAVIAERLAALGVDVSIEAVQRAERRARVRLDAELFARAAAVSTESRSTSGSYIRFILDNLGVTEEDVVQAITDWRRSYNLPIGVWDLADPRAEAALRRLRDTGVRAAVISNSNGSVRRILGTLGLLPYLDFVIDSFEEGVEKPDPRIFQLALARSRLRPAEAVYVGDFYSVDVLGARAVGMEAVLLDPDGCWGERDCSMASDVLAAVELILSAGR